MSTEFESRRDRLGEELPGRKLDAIIVSHGPNIRYLTGFSGSNGLLLLSRSAAVLYTDPRYDIQARVETSCEVRVARGPLWTALAKSLARKRRKRIGFENSYISFDAWRLLSELLPPGTLLAPAGGLVEQLRMCKSAGEIALIRDSVRTNSRAFEQTVRRIRPGVREFELAAELEHRMRRLGAEKPSFDTIVAFGEHTALPHAQPGPTALVSNQLLLIDMGASQRGYASDMTRMAFLGRPGTRVKQMYRAVLDAQVAAIDAVRQDVPAEKVDQAARRVLRKSGLDQAFVHSTGHGLGLEIHESPRIGKGDKTPLKAGMVITIEPGVYIEGFGGIRIEDTILVTENGCEILTPTKKELLVV